MVDRKENCIMTDRYNRIQGAVIKTQQKNYSVYKGINTIGRNKSAIINLKNLNVSQNHAVIIIVDDTQHFISDLNSSNGTFLVGTKLSPYKLYELVNDVEIKFGDVSASYSRVSNTDTTIHLQTESIDMTQNMTQNFYEAGTQLMINESSLNQTSSNNRTHGFCSDTNPDSDIHEGPTQIVDYQLATTSAAVHPAPKVKSQFNSLESDRIEKQQEMDIHEMPTQVVDLPQEFKKLAGQQEMSIHDLQTQIVDLPKELKKSVEEMDIHELPTQVVDLPKEFMKLKETEMDIHEMPTQIVDLPGDLNGLHKHQDLHKMAAQTAAVPRLESSENSNDSSTQLNEDIKKLDLTQSREKTSSDTDSNELFIQNTSDMCAVEETVIEETVIDESHLEKDEDSNDSIDFLAIHKPAGNEHATCNKETKSANDNDSIRSDSQDIIKFRKRPVRKLSSSEDVSQSHNNKPVLNSDSDTDIENEIEIPSKMKHQNLPPKEADVSGSETEIEDDLPEQFKNKSKILNSDSETDIDDEHLSYKEILTQSQNIKPKILNKKRVLDSDSETDIEDNKENDVVKQTNDESNTDALNDTDCIPPTQDAFDDMFVYKTAKVAANVNSQNESSEESFRLGLTELMAESIENKNEDNALEEDKTDNITPEENTNNVDIVGDDNGHQILKNDGALKLNSKGGDEDTITPRGLENKPDEDLYMAPTQRICTDTSKEEGNLKHVHVETLSVNQSKASINTEIKLTEDDFYMMPTQKLNEKETDNKQTATASTSKEADIEEDNDFYMMPTQKHNQDNNQPEFKTPRKKYNFKKKVVKLNESLSTIFGKKPDDPDDPYSAPTQKMNEEEDKTEDIYLQPTQKLNEEQKQCVSYSQPTQELNLTAPQKDEDLYMAPTQQINVNIEINNAQVKNIDSLLQENQHILSTKGTILKRIEKSDEDLYMAATQPINNDLIIKENSATKSVTDLYLQETQDLGLTKNMESSKNKTEKNITIKEQNKFEDKNENCQDKSAATTTEKDYEDPYLAMTQPMHPNLVDKKNEIRVNKSVTDIYLQETEDIGLIKNLGEKNEKIEDPYMIPTQQITEDTSGAGEKACSGTKRHIQSNINTSDLNKRRKLTDAETEKSSDDDTFIKTPLTILRKSSKSEAGSTVGISRGKTENTAMDQSETLSQIQRFVAETSHYSKKSKAKTLPKKRSSTDAQMEAQSETLSQIAAFIKKPLSTIKENTEENTSTPSKKQKKEKTSNKVGQVDEEAPKSERSTRSRRTTSKVQAESHISNEECGDFINKPESDLSTSSNKREIGKSDVEKEKTDEIEQVDEELPKHERNTRSRRTTLTIQSKTHMSKEECGVNKSDLQTSSDKCETGKIGVEKEKPSDEVAQVNEEFSKPERSTRSRRTIQSKTHISKDECGVFSKSESDLSTSSDKSEPGKSDVEKQKSSNKIEQVNEEFPKPERSTRSRRTTSTIQPKTHVSKEECGVFNKSESDLSTSSDKSEAGKSDSEKSFALLEAKSTKTRKSQKVANPVEVKVGVCKNRRSMATSAVPESPQSGSKSVESLTAFASPGKRKQKPKIVFTMLDSPLLESLIRQLGGSVVDSVDSSTVLVTEQVKRSQKLLTAVGQGKPICSPEWIRASKKANEFLDPWNYILLDQEAESKWNFSLRASLMRAGNNKLLANYTFQLMVNSAEDVLKGAIKACGGKCVPRCPAKNVDEFFVVIASPENKSKYLKIRKQHPQVIIVEPEAIFDGVLRQELRLDKHILV